MQTFDEKRTAQLANNKQIMITEKNRGKFVVLNNEAGIGRSSSFINAMVENFNLHPNSKTL